MKIYEFSYTDNLNQTESQVLETVVHFLEDESVLQSWAPDYTFHQCQKVEQLSTGERRYHFEVNGRFEDKDGDEAQDKHLRSSSSTAGIAAESDFRNKFTASVNAISNRVDEIINDEADQGQPQYSNVINESIG